MLMRNSACAFHFLRTVPIVAEEKKNSLKQKIYLTRKNKLLCMGTGKIYTCIYLSEILLETQP